MGCNLGGPAGATLGWISASFRAVSTTPYQDLRRFPSRLRPPAPAGKQVADVMSATVRFSQITARLPTWGPG